MNDTNVTRRIKRVDVEDLVLDRCCETDCFVTIMVEKNEKDSGRQNRCTACMMRNKLRGTLSK
jgi:hypothetical protein